MIKSSTIFKSRIKRWLDFIPLVILIIYAIKLVWTLSTTDIAFVWMNVVGLIILPVNIGMFFWNHKAGVLCLGATLILGLFEIVSFFPGTNTWSFGFGAPENGNLISLRIQPIYILWLTIHLLISNRYYFGVASKKYWQNFFDKSVM